MKIVFGNLGVKSLNDGMNLVVYKVIDRKKKDTDEKYQDEVILGYHSTVESVFKGLLKHKLKNNDAKSVKELLDYVKKVEAEVMEVARGCNLIK